MLVPSLNSATIDEYPSVLMDVMWRNPSTELIDFLDALGDLGFDGLRGDPRVDRPDAHDREVDVGEQVGRQLLVRKEPEHHEGGHHHGRKDRLLDRQVGKKHGSHCPASDEFLSTFTGEPSLSAGPISTTTNSPRASPSDIQMRSSRTPPIFTARARTTSSFTV